ncbi:MAG TPA: DNA-3-methyladenine glycosylase [Candidatus Saccharimonadales bacterium]|nr:DNA-3-methyladenine glycosylase [Candidatus Saccharimonadales bacterium]
MIKDPILQKLIKQYPAPEWTDRSEFLFEDLIETIISQQLSIKAADSIYKRFKQLFDQPVEESFSFPTPEQILSIEQGSIRQIGVSTSKAKYIHNVAQAFINKEIEINKIKTMTDAEVIDALVQIKGVGKWTAEMILIFTLNRPDVFSFGDLGLKNAIKNLYGITEKEEILQLVKNWSPHKSTASWYLWRSLENKK